MPKTPIRIYRNAVALLLLVMSLVLGLPPVASSQTVPPTEIAPTLLVLRVEVNTPAGAARLLAGGWDVLEVREGNALFVMGNETVQAQLAAQGFSLSVAETIRPQPSPQRPQSFFNGYRSVVEHEQHLDAVVAAYPGLAQVVVYGQSWRKTQGLSGFDLKTICITQLRAGDCALSPNTNKPRFFLMAAIHARELTTSELAWRWIDLLVNSYGGDPDITALLDHNEMWVVPVVNPDGRAIVEQGGNAPYLQRKNANDTMGNCAIPPTDPNQNHLGVDLNRNANFQWGTVGVSFSPCAQTFPGISAASEPEQSALETLFSQLFLDQRGPNITDTAPITTTGTLVTLHSYANLVLLPWGYTFTAAPNDAGLRALAFRMSHFNQYITGTGPETLYATSGTTDDFTYGTLGVASFTFEVGPVGGGCGGFTPPYNCVDGLFWPSNKGALLYAAKSARQPYATALGPTTLTPTLSSPAVGQGQAVIVRALVDDSRLGNTSGSVGRPAVQPISATELYIDTPPWAGGTPISLQALDGGFNTVSETAQTTLDTSGMSLGRHTLFVRGQNAGGNWGPVTAQWLQVNQPYFMPIIARE